MAFGGASGAPAESSGEDMNRFKTSSRARPLFNDRRKFASLADPRLEGHYPMRGLYQALAVASMCIQEQAAARL
ncbi:hypothetical protein L1887_37234 [Cichorium endivia]|nr:hypothetical protein L1887_37234 [Cichorium endivia]